MHRCHEIDFARLLGFATASDLPSHKIDFRDGHFGARLGAKVGDKVWAACDVPCASCDVANSTETPDETEA